MTTKPSRSLFIFCLLAGSLWAQDMTVSLRTMQLGGEEMPGLYVKKADAKEPAILTWLNTQPTEPIQVIHDGSLKLYKQTTDTEGKLGYEVASSVKLPGAEKEVLLLAWESNGELRYAAIKDHFLSANFNDWLAINTSQNPVAVLTGDYGKPVKIEAGKSLIFQPDIEQGKGVKILAQASRGGEVKTFLSTYWPAFEGQRTLIIFYDDGDKMRAKRIGDRFLKKDAPPE